MTAADCLSAREVFECSSLEEHIARVVAVSPKVGAVSGVMRDQGSVDTATKNCPNHLDSESGSVDSPVKCKSRTSFSKRKNNNRRKKRKWKPYSKLSWEERGKLAERETTRAYKVREEMTACGLTLAPYNTTQFLMDDHDLQEPNYNFSRKSRQNSNQSDAEEFYSSPDDEEEYLQKQFVEVYNDVHKERLNNMKDTELVEEYIHLQDQVDEIEKNLHEIQDHMDSSMTHERPSGFNIVSELEKIRVFKEEIYKLTLENDILERQNEMLQLQLEPIE